MHIPDGYLSPSTCLTLGAAMVPVWTVAAKKVKAYEQSRIVPLMAMASAFSFVIMMFNIPVLGGTTAHAVGGGLLAVVLGPWAASICITIALAIQALLFGDGGVWAFGANCFNMAFLLPFSAWAVYRLVAGNSGLKSPRRWIGAALGGYVGINVAALATAVELGLQPLLFHAADGTPLYCPFPIGVAVPAMMVGHLVLAGPLEGVVTALVVRYLQATDTDLLTLPTATAPATGAPALPAAPGRAGGARGADAAGPAGAGHGLGRVGDGRGEGDRRLRARRAREALGDLDPCPAA